MFVFSSVNHSIRRDNNARLSCVRIKLVIYKVRKITIYVNQSNVF